MGRIDALDATVSRPDSDSPEITKDVALYPDRQELRKAVRSFETRDSLIYAFELGRIVERMNVRWAEPLVKHEKSRRKGQSGGMECRKAKAVRIFNEFMPAEHPLPDNNKGTLIKWIIKRFAEDGEKVSERSLSTYLKGLS